MNLFRNRLVRLPIIAIGFAALLGIFSHRALAAFEGTAKMSMPRCHGTSPANQSPAKHDEKGGVECCKVLRATLLTPSTNLVSCDTFTFAAHDYIVALISAADELRLTPVIEWDTGPPEADSFAES